MHRAQGKPQPDAHGWRELKGTDAFSRTAGRKITADGKEGPGDRRVHFTLASPPARLRWRHGTARTRHGGHITENPQGHAPHGRVKAEPAATSFVLCPGTGRKKAGISPPTSSFPDFCQGIRHAADFGPGLPDHLPQNTPVKPAAGRFIWYTQHIAGQPTGQDMLNTLTDQVHFHC